MTPMSPMPHGLSLLTDLYQLTMAYGYWKNERHRDEAVFHLFYRRPPFAAGCFAGHRFGGDHVVACGMRAAADYLEGFGLDASDVAYLGTLEGNDGAPLFDRAFIDALATTHLSLDVDALPEGTIVFPRVPMMRVRGPLWLAQIVESALLNVVNFHTLVATKARRVVDAAGDADVLEFGLRRAQGIDGAMAATYAAWIGGAAATSNVLAGKRWGIPVRGTHAHSWVMTFDDEPTAFAAYARAMPNNCVFLVDTYDTRRGIDHAIEAGRALAAAGRRMIGIRLDSGDLAELSRYARRRLDEAGLTDAVVVASDDLDETRIAALRAEGAAIGMWGVGTRLVTAFDQPALGGVYKLGALRRDGGAWERTMKLSDEPAKASVPGILQVRRYRDGERPVGDVIYDACNAADGPGDDGVEVVGFDVDQAADAPDVRTVSGIGEDLLLPLIRDGRRVAPAECPHVARERANDEQRRFALATSEPGAYTVGVSMPVHRTRARIVARHRGAVRDSR